MSSLTINIDNNVNDQTYNIDVDAFPIGRFGNTEDYLNISIWECDSIGKFNNHFALTLSLVQAGILQSKLNSALDQFESLRPEPE